MPLAAKQRAVIEGQRSRQHIKARGRLARGAGNITRDSGVETESVTDRGRTKSTCIRRPGGKIEAGIERQRPTIESEKRDYTRRKYNARV